MKKKGFTLIELLVVIAIIAMLLAILMPALNKVKKIAQRVVCGTNLKGLGTAMIVYGNDYDDRTPRQGGRTTVQWAEFTDQWRNKNQTWSDSSLTKNVTIGASLYLLVREADVSPKSFRCPSGAETEYDGTTEITTNPPDIVELWDFGANAGPASLGADSGPKSHVSYSYQMPYGTGGGSSSFVASFATNSAAFALMADKNPWMDSRLTQQVASAIDGDNFKDSVCQLLAHWLPTTSIDKPKIEATNSQPHDRVGQNVMHADGHSSFEKTPDIGAKNDNIYTPHKTTGTDETKWRQGDHNRMRSLSIGDMSVQPRSSRDSVLYNDDMSLQ